MIAADRTAMDAGRQFNLPWSYRPTDFASYALRPTARIGKSHRLPIRSVRCSGFTNPDGFTSFGTHFVKPFGHRIAYA
jgi:hypothetical protein